MQTLWNILLVGAGGFVGSAARYSAGLLARGIGGDGKWPWATFGVNLLGSLLIGLLWGKSLHMAEPRLILTLGMAGFCGGFTTFSAFSLEIVELLRSGDYGLGLLYVALSVALCVGGAFIGLMLAKG